jgi:two-component system, NtrC family, nitrogen regulation sensor histidine kinase NtrY
MSDPLAQSPDSTPSAGVIARLKRAGLPRLLVLGFMLGTLPSVAATFLAMTVSGPAAPDPRTVLSLLGLDVVLLIGLGVVVVSRILRVRQDRRQGVTGARLQLRLITLFAIVAVFPSLVMSLGSGLFLRYGMESWFSDRVRTAVQASLEVASAYLAEHQQVIGGDALAMANDINREAPKLLTSPQAFNTFISTQAAIRSLSEAIVFDTQGRILAKSGLAFSIEMGVGQIPLWAFEKANSGEAAVLTVEDDQRVRALVHLTGFYGETYLYVGRFVDPKVIAHVERTSSAAAEYERLEGRRSGLELAFSLVFAVISMLLLTSVVWVGLSMATNLAAPIVRLIDATERVRRGDFSTSVDEGEPDEMGQLSRAFNRMTDQLDQQRHDLVAANSELDERNHFIETVLNGVSAGVIGLNNLGTVTLVNPSAARLLSRKAESMINHSLAELIPAFADSLHQAQINGPERQVRSEVEVIGKDGGSRTLLVRVAQEEAHGYIVTFDDITELVSAQRKAAWADVARRIAHEIKNPLTPIQLSADRLKRKYFKEISSDPETFLALVETIIRQVGDIGRMVDEFSSFARMPQPHMKDDNLVDICRQAVFMQRTGYPDVRFETILPETAIMHFCDARLIGQALTNLLKNSVESIMGREGEGELLDPGHVMGEGCHGRDGTV